MDQRLDRGTDADFAEFVEVQARPLLGLAHALTANPHDAWDLAGDAGTSR